MRVSDATMSHAQQAQMTSSQVSKSASLKFDAPIDSLRNGTRKGTLGEPNEAMSQTKGSGEKQVSQAKEQTSKANQIRQQMTGGTNGALERLEQGRGQHVDTKA